MSKISQENAYIFRITHIDNVPWLLRNGIHCRNSGTRDTNFRQIGDPELIQKRSTRQVPTGNGGVLSDYVPFYFTPFSPMLYKIKTGHGVTSVSMSDIVILASSLPTLVQSGTPFVFTDRHAYLLAARFFTDLKDLDVIDWPLIASRDFKRDTNDLEKVERYQAEALVHRHFPISALLAIICHDSKAKSRVVGMQTDASISLNTVVNSSWFF